MGEPFRPADRLVPGFWWDSVGAKFDLAGLDSATKAALLRQWATAPYLRAEIARAAKSAQGFANTFGASVNHLRNMCNGHRLPDYPTLALVLSVAGPANAPNEAAIAKAMHDAVTRSTPKQPKQPKPSRSTGMGYVSIGGSQVDDDLSGPSAPGARKNVAVPHPDADAIRAVFARAVLGDPLVHRLQGVRLRRHRDDPRELAEEVSVFVAPSLDQVGVDGFVTQHLLAATLRVPYDWTRSVAERGGGIAGGAFVCAAVEGNTDEVTRFLGARVAVEAGTAPEDWDLTVVTRPARYAPGGSLQWTTA